jgi:signal transduction histidine kinase
MVSPAVARPTLPGWLPVASASAATLLTALTLPFVGVSIGNLVLMAVIVGLTWLGCVFRPREHRVFGEVVIVAASLALASNPGSPVLFLVCIICAGATVEHAAREAGAVVGTALLAVLVRAATVGGIFGPLDYFPWPLGFVCSAVGGLFVGAQMRLTAELRSKQTLVASEAAADERRRLAREIHDVIAHSMTVTMLHVSGARLALQDDPPSVTEALDALGEAERQGRQSLADIRRTVGLLAIDAPGESQLAAPLPGASDIPALVAGFADAGLSVALRSDGDLSTVPPTIGLAVYRVVQESLANAAKHAPGAAVTVELRVCHGVWPLSSFSSVTGKTGRVDVEVSNAGPTLSAPLIEVPPGGLGVSGMSERVRALGGRLSAGPEDRGWRVCARLPIGTEAAVPTDISAP